MLIDTHAHLCAEEFRHDLEAVIERALEAGVERIVAVGEDHADALRNLEIAERFPGVVRPAAGLFPTHLDLDEADRLIELIRAEAHRWVAIGEVGLDHWKVQGEDELRLQREIFDRFVDLAIELDLPVNVHSRSAGRRTIEALLERGARRVQMHAFDGRAASARPGVEAGYYFSIPPSVRRSPQKQKLVRQLPFGALLLETDSPVLGVEASLRNEPAQVAESLAAVAEIRGLDSEHCAAAMRRATYDLYGDRL